MVWILDMLKWRCLTRAKRWGIFISTNEVWVWRLIRANNCMEVDTLGEAEGGCIEYEVQEAQQVLARAEGGKPRMWQCRGNLEELSSAKGSTPCIYGLKSFLSFNGWVSCGPRVILQWGEIPRDRRVWLVMETATLTLHITQAEALNHKI